MEELIYYAGIGARATPLKILTDMETIAYYLHDAGYILRSGGADGADSAFEKHCGDRAEIFLPKNGFNGKYADGKKYFVLSVPEARQIAATFHPAWQKCNETARNFHTRNVHQILGIDLLTPSKFVVCWTKDGKASGGTGQALRIAKSKNIPIFNLYDMSVKDIGMSIYNLVNKKDT